MPESDYKAAVKAKQVVVKQKTKIRTKARHFALKMCLNSTSKGRKYSKELVKSFIFLKINKRWVLVRSVGLETHQKINRLGRGAFC